MASSWESYWFDSPSWPQFPPPTRPAGAGSWIRLPCPCCPAGLGSGSGASGGVSGGGDGVPPRGATVRVSCSPYPVPLYLQWTLQQLSVGGSPVSPSYTTPRTSAPWSCCVPRYEGTGIAVGSYSPVCRCTLWAWGVTGNPALEPYCHLSGVLTCGCYTADDVALNSCNWALDGVIGCGDPVVVPFGCLHGGGVTLEVCTLDPLYLQFHFIAGDGEYRLIFTE